MPKLTLDGLDYNTEDLSERGLILLKSLQHADRHLESLAMEAEILKTARQVYVEKLKQQLEEEI
jgi:hypothetical protein